MPCSIRKSSANSKQITPTPFIIEVKKENVYNWRAECHHSDHSDQSELNRCSDEFECEYKKTLKEYKEEEIEKYAIDLDDYGLVKDSVSKSITFEQENDSDSDSEDYDYNEESEDEEWFHFW